MKGGYPPGTSRRDLQRAGIIDPEVHCPACDRSIKSEDHEDWCELRDAELDEIKELAAEDRMATEYDPIEHGDRGP